MDNNQSTLKITYVEDINNDNYIDHTAFKINSWNQHLKFQKVNIQNINKIITFKSDCL